MPEKGMVIKNPKIYMGGFNISANLNKIDLPIEVEMLPANNFNSTGQEFLPGEITTKFNYSGYVVAGGTSAIDPMIFDSLSAPANESLTICPTNGTTGEVAYSMPVRNFSYKQTGEHGKIFMFDVTASAQDVPINGTVIFTRTISVSGDATAFDFGAHSTGDPLYGTLHVVNVASSGKFVAVIESACSSGFTSPTERITFTPSSGVNAQMSMAAPTCSEHQYFRVVYGASGLSAGKEFTSMIAFGLNK